MTNVDLHRFDVILTSPAKSHIEFHHCRSWDIDPDTNDWLGCYGTNPNHGSTFEEARGELVQYLERQYQIAMDYDDGNAEKILENLDYYTNITYDKWIEELEM